MKQSVLIASVLAAGVVLGAGGIAAFHAVKSDHPAAPALVMVASAPVAQVVAAPPVVAPAPVAVAKAEPAPVVRVSKPKPKHATHAKILAVSPIKETTTVTKQVCHEEQFTHQAPVEDQNRITGSVIGGVIGGLLGNQVGNGNGKKLAAVAGALAGGYAGNQVQDNMQKKDVVVSTRTICKDEPVPVAKTVAWSVRYSLDGKTGTVRMQDKPQGKTLPARDGRLLID